MKTTFTREEVLQAVNDAVNEYQIKSYSERKEEIAYKMARELVEQKLTTITTVDRFLETVDIIKKSL